MHTFEVKKGRNAYWFMNWNPDWLGDRDNISAICEMTKSKQPLQLLQSNYNGSSSHESDDSGMRQKIHKKAQSSRINAKTKLAYISKVHFDHKIAKDLPEQTKCKLEDTSKECHSENQFSVKSWINCRVNYLLNHWWKQDWHDGDWPNGYLPRGPRYSVYKRWHNTCILPQKQKRIFRRTSKYTKKCKICFHLQRPYCGSRFARVAYPMLYNIRPIKQVRNLYAF